MGAGAWQEDEPVAVLLGALRQAVNANDHARIKEIMRDLVAMGDDAVMPLAEIVSSGRDETALWAADALARIGTPAATAALLDTLELVKDGFYREQLAKRASNITNHDSWPLLLDAVQDSQDPTVRRAAAASLSGMADVPVVDEIVARYDAAATEEEAARLAQIVSNIDSPGASESLRALAGDVSSVPQDSLQQAALDALAKIGDAQSVSYLLRKLEASAPGENSYVYNAVTTIEQPQAHAALLYAAAGNKEVSAEQGRTAAIYALGNYPSEETYRLLQQIVAAEDNTAVATAALRTLEHIEKKEPAIAETTTSKAETVNMLPFHPLQK
jgi:HEAT repeat protein